MIRAVIWENSDDPSDDVIFVRLASMLSWRERALRFGLDGLDPRNAARVAESGALIPTDAYLDRIEEVYDDPVMLNGGWRLTISAPLVRAYVDGKLTGREVLNRWGEEVLEFCREWEFELE